MSISLHVRYPNSLQNVTSLMTEVTLFWEMTKMVIRATTIIYAKRKARKKRDEKWSSLLA